MKSFQKELLFDVPSRMDCIVITPEVEEFVAECRVEEGIVLCSALEATSSVFFSDNDYGIKADILEWIEKNAPHRPLAAYHHNSSGLENGDALIKALLLGRSVTLALTGGALEIGGGDIFYGEFDGRKRKRILIKIIGE